MEGRLTIEIVDDMAEGLDTFPNDDELEGTY